MTYDPAPLRRPLAVDLFSGVGGLALGFEQAGFDVVAAVEYDPVHATTHLFNFPQTEILCRDIGLVTADQVRAAARKGFARVRPDEKWDGRLDALIGGPPCQGFSSGGKREDGDARNELLGHFVRLVEELRPATFCLENVNGLLESKFDVVREGAFKRLRAAGYALSGTDSAVDAVNFGVPQGRKRVLVLGTLGDRPPGRPAQVSGSITVEQALSGLPDPSTYDVLLQSDEATLSDVDLLARSASQSAYARRLAGLDSDVLDLSYERAWDPGLLTSSRRTIHQAEVVKRFGETLPGTVEPISRFYRLPLDGPSRTLRAGTGSERGSHTSPRPIHPTEPRVITAREAARLHGYPDWFRFHTTNWHAHRQIGNSVPPPLARAAAQALIDALHVEPARPGAVEASDSSLLSLSPRGSELRLMDVVVEQLPKKRRRPVSSEDAEQSAS
ncbi:MULTISPECIES: DNA cytosine methyltransferase [unclassified Nocardioides]|uniref:DNA cytosine methyltransferase n=1 Tax=unclassified Nocardioides TaxID=2615069 RepID=UPI001885C3AE|nr:MULTISPECIES: DNA cytosine methyltransferase [unclassified Nocardioides]